MSITANTSNWGLDYSYSWWGNATTTSEWGSVYLVSYLMSDLRRRTSTYENNYNDYSIVERYKRL